MTTGSPDDNDFVSQFNDPQLVQRYQEAPGQPTGTWYPAGPAAGGPGVPMSSYPTSAGHGGRRFWRWFLMIWAVMVLAGVLVAVFLR